MQGHKLASTFTLHNANEDVCMCLEGNPPPASPLCTDISTKQNKSCTKQSTVASICWSPPPGCPGLNELQEALATAASKWYQLGLKLGLTSTELHEVESMHRDSECSVFLEEMLKSWLEKGPSQVSGKQELGVSSVS